MAAFAPPLLFAAWRVEAPFFRGFPFRWVLHFVLSLTRGVVLHDSASCSMEDSLDECGRPCDTLSCLLFSALWLRCNQSILVQETQSAEDTDMTRSKMLLIKATTCLQVVPMSLDWPVHPFARSDFSRSSLPPGVPSGEQQRGALPASTRSRWRQNALQPPHQVLQRLQVGMDVALSLLEVIGSVFLRRRKENSNSNISKCFLTTTLYVFRKYMEEASISRLSRCWLRGFGFLVLSFLETKTQEDRLSAFTMIFYPKEAIVTHLITCQGRDHIVNLQSGRQSLVIVKVHFEPELTLRQLRERLCLLTRHWPSYPNAVCIILGDFNICEPEEGRFNVWNQTCTDGDPRKTAMFHSFCHTSLRLLNLITRGGTPQPLGTYSLFQELIAF